jgi:hypothetical protein
MHLVSIVWTLSTSPLFDHVEAAFENHALKAAFPPTGDLFNLLENSKATWFGVEKSKDPGPPRFLLAKIRSFVY